MEERTNETPRRRVAAEGAQPSSALDALGSFDVGQALEKVSGFARENPHTALAAAAAVGFVLGGGLTPRIVGAAAMFAGRRYLNQALRDTLDGALRAQLEAR
jgi:hypothetical protein